MMKQNVTTSIQYQNQSGDNFTNILWAAFCMKVFCPVFLYLQFLFVILWQKEICKKTTCKISHYMQAYFWVPIYRKQQRKPVASFSHATRKWPEYELHSFSHLKSHSRDLHWLLFFFCLIFNEFHGYLDMQWVYQRW